MLFGLQDRQTQEEMSGDPASAIGTECGLCNVKDWDYVVSSRDDEAFNWIDQRIGGADGFVLSCFDCFDNEIKDLGQYKFE